jgi:alcohol dehydrogenase class IV
VADEDGDVDVTEFRTQEGLQAVVAGVGSVRARLAGVLAAAGVERPMVVCGANLARSPVLAEVRSVLPPDVVVFDGCRPHTPVEAVDAGAARARLEGADGLVAVGGSSSIDCAKGIARLLATGLRGVSDLAPIELGRLGGPAPRPSVAVRPVPVVTITTTLSFAEFLPFWGARHRDPGRKLAYAAGGAATRTVFLDGGLAAHTPDAVWAETGVKGLDDALSAYCRSVGDEPFLDPILERAVADLVEWLPRSLGPDRAGERQRVLTATWMTKQPLPRLGPVAGAWLSTAARHALGSVVELSHGVGSCVALPACLRWHAAATHDRQARLAAAIGWPPAPDPEPPLGPGLDRLLDQLGVPRRLGVVPDDQLDRVAQAMVHEAPLLGDVAAVRAVLADLR